MKQKAKLVFMGLFFLTYLALNACSPRQVEPSNVKVTEIDHTIVKRQSIGNCWLYATATWLESMYKEHYNEDIDVSESYWTWWHWYDNIINSSITELQTGGSWGISSSIILRHGFVMEGEFVEEEKDMEMSITQAKALNQINQQLMPGGRLGDRRDRTPENVRKELDLAFGTDMTKTESLARHAEDIIIRKNGLNETTTVAAALDYQNVDSRWDEFHFPDVYGKDTPISDEIQKQRDEIMRRILIALNDEWPVVMSVMIDFNALDVNDQTFKASLLKEKGIGRQGGHMVVLDDYMVKDVPGLAPPQIMGEGNYGKEYRHLALKGKIMHLRAKNSWGKNRPDRGLTDGYTRFDWEYLSSQLEWKWNETSTSTSYYTTLQYFVLPPGY